MSRRTPKPNLEPYKERKPIPRQLGGRHIDRKKEASRKAARNYRHREGT